MTTNTKTTTTILSELSIPIRNEVRCCVATKIVSTIFQLGTMSIRKIEEKMDDMYHGTTDTIPHIDLVIQGKYPYDRMYEESIPVVTDDRDTNPPTLILNKSVFVLDRDFVVGRHLTKTFLQNKTMIITAGLVRGRTLHRSAKTSMANMKKAYAFLILMPEVEEVTREGVVYKSGISEDEVKNKLLDTMYIELNGKSDVVNIDEDNDDIPRDTPDTIVVPPGKKRPHGWFFTGWFAFCLFGPFVCENQRITIFEKGGNLQDNLKINGRAAKREFEKKESESARDSDDRNVRGLSHSMKAGIAGFQMKDKELKQQNKDSTIIALNCRIQNIQKSIERADQRAQRCCPVYDKNNEFWIKVIELEAEAKILEKQLDVVIYDTEIKIEDEGGTELLNKYITVDCDSTPKRTRLSSEYSYLDQTSSSNSTK
jgi:hypothetical protein